MDERRLPLFPLAVVLFPGATIPLHIFEPRYRQMVSTILTTDRIFGLLYHDPDESGPFLNEPGTIGTVAEILEHQPIPDGRSLVVIKGLLRFRILREVEEGAPYYEAWVREYSDKPTEDPVGLVGRRLYSIQQFLEALRKDAGVPANVPSLSSESELSFRLAGFIQAEPSWQQELLELRQESERLDRIDDLLTPGTDLGDAGRGERS
jgi:Lon protease-like protein